MILCITLCITNSDFKGFCATHRTSVTRGRKRKTSDNPLITTRLPRAENGASSACRSRCISVFCKRTKSLYHTLALREKRWFAHLYYGVSIFYKNTRNRGFTKHLGYYPIYLYMNYALVIMIAKELREECLKQIEDEVLRGGICLEDWTSFQLENAYISFCAGADLSCILMCQAAIESFLRRDEHISSRSFYDVIEKCSLSKKLKDRLHHLRQYRNKWMHIDDSPSDNAMVIDNIELEEMAIFSYRLTLEVFHYYPFI